MMKRCDFYNLKKVKRKIILKQRKFNRSAKNDFHKHKKCNSHNFNQRYDTFTYFSVSFF